MPNNPSPEVRQPQNSVEAMREEVARLLQYLIDIKRITEEGRQSCLEAFSKDPVKVFKGLRYEYVHLTSFYVERLGACDTAVSWNRSSFNPNSFEEHVREVDVSFKIMADLAKKHVKEGDWIMDLGCGTGLASRPLAEKGAIVVGVDQSMKMLEAFRRQKVDNLLPGIQLMLNKNTHLPFENGTFAHIVSNGVLYYIVGGIEPTIKECARVLRSPSRDDPQGGGMIHFSITCTQGRSHELRLENGIIVNQETRDNSGSLAFYYEWENVVKILRDNGFKVVECFDAPVHTESGCENEVIYTFVSARKVA